jgi:hypothetical protein
MKRLMQIFLILIFWGIFVTPVSAEFIWQDNDPNTHFITGWRITDSDGITYEASRRVGSFNQIWGDVHNYPAGSDIYPHVDFLARDWTANHAQDSFLGLGFFIAHIAHDVDGNNVGALVDDIWREQIWDPSAGEMYYFWLQTSYVIDPDRVVTWAYFAPIPEPSSIFLLCLGLIGLSGINRKL